MMGNQDMYTGLKARVLTEGTPKEYSLRAPRYMSFHLDQELPDGIKTAADGYYKGQPTSPDTVKFKTEFQGIPIHVDRPKGFVMKGSTDNGIEWRRKYDYDYGFIPKTKGGDGDGIDVFLGPNKKAPEAYWAIQTKPDGSFDEYKVFLGFADRDTAMSVYRNHIPKKLLNGMVTIRVELMKAMLGLDSDGLIKKTAGLRVVSFLDELQRLGVTCAI